MLRTPRPRRCVDNFAGQWLFTRALDDHEPDYASFPEFDDGLRGAMRKETRARTSSEFLFGDETLDRLLTADFSFVNDRLAAALRPDRRPRDGRRVRARDARAARSAGACSPRPAS